MGRGAHQRRNSDDLNDWSDQICEPRWRLRGIVWLIWWIKMTAGDLVFG